MPVMPADLSALISRLGGNVRYWTISTAAETKIGLRRSLRRNSNRWRRAWKRKSVAYNLQRNRSEFWRSNRRKSRSRKRSADVKMPRQKPLGCEQLGKQIRAASDRPGPLRVPSDHRCRWRSSASPFHAVGAEWRQCDAGRCAGQRRTPEGVPGGDIDGLYVRRDIGDPQQLAAIRLVCRNRQYLLRLVGDALDRGAAIKRG